MAALDYYTQADEILAVTLKKHDFCIRINMSLSHVSAAIDLKKAKLDNSNHITSSSCMCKCSSLNDGSGFGHAKNLSPSISGNCPDFQFDCCSMWQDDVETSKRCCHFDCKKSLVEASGQKQSAKFYFEKVVALASNSEECLSDHGHGYLISALQHLILIDSGNVQSASAYAEQMIAIMTRLKWIVNQKQKPEDKRNSFMNSHFKLLSYLQMAANVSVLEMGKVEELVRSGCNLCKNVPYIINTSWQTQSATENDQSNHCQCHEPVNSQICEYRDQLPMSTPEISPENACSNVPYSYNENCVQSSHRFAEEQSFNFTASSNLPPILPSNQPSTQTSTLPLDQPLDQPYTQPSTQPSTKLSQQPSHEPLQKNHQQIVATVLQQNLLDTFRDKKKSKLLINKRSSSSSELISHDQKSDSPSDRFEKNQGIESGFMDDISRNSSLSSNRLSGSSSVRDSGLCEGGSTADENSNTQSTGNDVELFSNGNINPQMTHMSKLSHQSGMEKNREPSEQDEREFQ